MRGQIAYTARVSDSDSGRSRGWQRCRTGMPRQTNIAGFIVSARPGEEGGRNQPFRARGIRVSPLPSCTNLAHRRGRPTETCLSLPRGMIQPGARLFNLLRSRHGHVSLCYIDPNDLLWQESARKAAYFMSTSKIFVQSQEVVSYAGSLSRHKRPDLWAFWLSPRSNTAFKGRFSLHNLYIFLVVTSSMQDF